MESEGSGSTVASVRKDHVPTNAEQLQLQTELKNWRAEQLQTELKNWCASKYLELNAAETKRKYTLPSPPDWKCIICDTVIRTYPVYQCQTGHLECNACSEVGSTCRSCSKAVSRIKNKAVENMMKSLMVTCKFAKLGCKEVNLFMEHSMHEDSCSLKFTPLVCPMPSCKQAGVKNLLAQHLLAKHRISCQVDVGELTRDKVYYGSYDKEYRQHTREFDLDSTSTLVLLRHLSSKELHLLHHQSTALGTDIKLHPWQSLARESMNLT